MDWTMLHSDAAIIIYEIIALGILLFFVKKMAREKKEALEALEASEKLAQEEKLKNQLSNDKRRAGV